MPLLWPLFQRLATLIGLAIIGIRVPTGFVIRIPFMEALIAGIIGYFLNLGTLPGWRLGD